MFKIISNITTINNTKFADVIFINDVVEHVFLNVLLDNKHIFLKILGIRNKIKTYMIIYYHYLKIIP